MDDAINEQDATFVKQFLDEINDMEKINDRVKKNLEQKTIETYMRYGDNPNADDFVAQGNQMY